MTWFPAFLGVLFFLVGIGGMVAVILLTILWDGDIAPKD